MKLPRRYFLHLAAGAAALPAVSRIARAQAYPSRPVRIVVGYAPGGGNDIFGRLIGQWLSERLGQQLRHREPPRSGQQYWHRAVVNAPPDGYTLLLVVGRQTHQRNALRQAQFQFQPRHRARRRYLPGPNIMVVHPRFRPRPVPEFIATPRPTRASISVATPGIGSPRPRCRRAVQDDGRRRA